MKAIILLMLGCFPCALFCQVVYNYDASGNRVKSSLIVTLEKTNIQQGTHPQNIVQNEADALKCTVSPNPVVDEILIQTKSESTSSTVVYDLNGKELDRFSFTSHATYKMQSYSQGVYFIVVDSDGKKQTWKIIKN